MSLIIPFSLLLLALLPPSFGIDYFDQQSRQQRVQSQANPQQPSPFQPLGSQQQQQRQPQPFGSGLQQTRNGFPQQPSPTGQLGLGFPKQQQQPTGIGANPAFGAGIGQQRQQDQYEFGRQLQQQQQGRNSSSFGDGNPFQQQPGGIGGSLPDPNYQNTGNVLVEVSLHSYANSRFELPNHLLCTCPRGNDHCVQASPQKIGYTCLTSLSVFVLSADSQLNFFETPYTPLNANGQLNFVNQQQQQQQHQQSSQFSHQFILDSPPSAIGILVYNLGAQIDHAGAIQETNTVTRVDTFIQSLNDTLPGSNSPFGGPGAGQQQANLRGQQGTELSFSYSFSCHGARGPNGKPLVGPGCDLSCNASSATGTTAMCVSQKTGYFSQCRWTAGNTQVSNCQHCPWGIKEDAYCADEQGGVLQPDHAGVVSSFYYKAFIALGVLCLILITCLILVCLLSLRNNVKSRRNGGGGYRAVSAPRNEAAAAGFTTTSTRVHRGEPEAAALNASAFKAPPPYSYRTNGEQPGVHSQTAAMSANPLPLPRSNASTASAESEMRSSSAAGGAGGGVGRRFPAILPPLVVAGKSGKMLSPPRYQPLPHLGAAAFAGTDSLNSSFAGNVPLAPPSVSADV